MLIGQTKGPYSGALKPLDLKIQRKINMKQRDIKHDFTLQDLKHFVELDESCPSGLRFKNPMPWWFYTERAFGKIQKMYQGKPAGSLEESRKKGRKTYYYWPVRLKGKPIRCHRIVWMLTHDVQLTDDQIIDHEDGDTENNAAWNLRLANKSENSTNSKLHKTNTTGYKGVYPAFRRDIFLGYGAAIKKNGVSHRLGVFSTPQEAHAAYKEKAKELHGEFAKSC
jgi:HNH endonuclease